MPFKHGKDNYNSISGPWNKGIRDWKREMATTAARLEMCVVFPDHLTANTRVTCSCPHGAITHTTVYRFVNRHFCCKSQASKDHPRELKQRAAMESSGIKVRTGQEHLPGILYLIRYIDESGTHFKLGITKLTLPKRFQKGQLISIIHLHHTTLGECFDLEQSLLRWAKQHGHRYSSPTTTELLHPAAIPYILAQLTATRVKLDRAPI